MRQRTIYICSDSIGETADAVVRATVRQFQAEHVKIKRYGHLRLVEEIRFILEDAKQQEGFVAYTLVQPELRECMRVEAARLGVRAVDIMGPMMDAFTETFHDHPAETPGLLHQLDADYYRRVEAMEFAVRFDDGRDPKGLLQAQIVLIGVSRTSKTPLSIYLAHKGFKVANWPLLPEVKVPEELFLIPAERVFGLMMSPDRIMQIREQRLKTVGLPPNAKYATSTRIYEELQFASQIMERIGCCVLDVSGRAIEETAGLILDQYLK